MRRSPWSTTLFLLSASLATTGCAASNRVQPGLANGPRLGGEAAIESHDVVANAQDSCPRARIAGTDPLSHRIPPCPSMGESTPHAAPRFAAKVAEPPAMRGTPWNLHLEGLPPCEGPLDAWETAELGPLCTR